MRKKICFLIIVSLISSSILINVSASTTLNDLQKKKIESASKIQQAKNIIKDKTNTKKDLSAQVDDLDKQLTDSATKLNDTTNQLVSLNKDLDQSRKDLKEATNKKNQQQVTLEKRMRYIYEYGKISYFDTIISATSFNDFLNRINYIKRIANYDQNMFAQFKNTEDLVNTKVKEINTKKIQVETLQAQEIQNKATLESQVVNKTELMKQINADISEAQKQADLEAQASNDIEKMMRDLEAKQAADAKKNNSAYQQVKYTGGRLLWPVPSMHTISSPFGYRIDPYNKVHALHTGIDIPAPVGSAVVADADGVVVYASWMSGFGNTVVLDNGGGLSTLYGHNSVILVKVGQYVKRGQQVTKSGNTGNSTGPHCHFQVMLHGTPVNPKPYLGLGN